MILYDATRYLLQSRQLFMPEKTGTPGCISYQSKEIAIIEMDTITHPNDVSTRMETAVEIQPIKIIEAILMAADTPVPAAKIASILDNAAASDVRQHIETLNRLYETMQSSFRIELIAGGYQILTLPEYNPWLVKLLRTRQESRLSPAALETLAIVAYKQPCTRAEIEAIRGVAAGDMLSRLRDANLIKIVGRAEDLGRPLLYGTTKQFLETFGLPSLDDLPEVEVMDSGVTPSTSEKNRTPDEPSDATDERGENATSVELDDTPANCEQDDSEDTCDPHRSSEQQEIQSAEEDQDPGLTIIHNDEELP